MSDCPHGEPHPAACLECIAENPTARPRSQAERGIAECSTCKAPIIWVVTAKGKRMPLDATPSTEGRFVMTGGTVTTTHGSSPSVAFDSRGDYPNRDHFTSHFANCDQRDEHRHKR